MISKLAIMYNLRYRIFCEELGWFPENDHRLEVDDHDLSAIHNGIYLADRLVAYYRMVLHKNRFMIEGELGNRHKFCREIRKEEDTVELSRVCCDLEFRGRGFFSHMCGEILDWCRENGKRFVYATVSEAGCRLVRMEGIPYRIIGVSRHRPLSMVILINVEEI